MAEQAQELHVRELARQREHEQLVAQIARTDRAVDDCCRPIQAAIEGLQSGRALFVSGAVVELEAVAPEAVARMLGQGQKLMYAVNDKGQAVSLRLRCAVGVHVQGLRWLLHPLQTLRLGSGSGVGRIL